MILQEFKDTVDRHGRNEITSDSVMVVENGSVTIINTDDFVLNSVSINEVVWNFSRNFNDTAIETLLPCLNRMIEQSKRVDLLTL
jgi:hypothetical protein